MMNILRYSRSILSLGAMLSLAIITLPGCEKSSPEEEGHGELVVLEYHPAPGQFVNLMPEYQVGDTPETMAQKCTRALRNDEPISLGSWGGYIVLTFNHTVKNQDGDDLEIMGNASISQSEPGIIEVMVDENGNGLPDDQWYELQGSRYLDGNTRHNYQVTYTFTPGHQAKPDPDNPHIIDTEHVRWEDNLQAHGFIQQNEYHTQDYWPRWLPSGQALQFNGCRLPDNAVQDPKTKIWTLTYENLEGYVDVMGNSTFDIANAVDGQGKPIHLEGIDFIRIYSATLQQTGWTGEASTEVSRVRVMSWK